MEVGEEVSSTSENDTKVSPCEEPMDVEPSKKPVDAVPESIVESSAEKTEEDVPSPKGIKVNGDLSDEGTPSPKIVDSAIDSDNASAISSTASNACSDVPDSSVTSSEPEPKCSDQAESGESEKLEDVDRESVGKTQAVSSETQPVSSETQAVSSENQAVSSETQAVSSETQAVSSETQAVSSETHAVSSGTQAVSSETQPVSSETQAVSNETQSVSSETQILAISSPTVSATSIGSPKEQPPIVTCTKSDNTELSLESLQNSSRSDSIKKDSISLVEKLALNSSITVSRKESKPKSPEPKADSPPPEGRVLRLRPIPKPEPPKILSKPSKPIESRKTSTSSNNSNEKSGSKSIKSQKRKHDDGDDVNEKSSSPIQYKGYKKVATIKELVKKSIIKFNPFNPAFRRDCSSEPQMVCSNFDSSSLQPEYAQYLGLRPLLKFRCSNCGMSSFQTMNALTAHQAECTQKVVGVQQSAKLPYATGQLETSQEPKSANIKLTRKVFLCSACGTYYELWNLFLHMREAHRRYICLQCLGMSSSPEKLSEHLKQKHGIQAQVGDDPEKFAPPSMPPAFYLLCITCDKIYSEADKFASHKCQGKKVEEVASSSKSSVVSSQTQTSDLPVGGVEAPSQKQPLRRTRESTKKASKLAQAKKESEAQKAAQKEVVEAEQNEPIPEKMEVSSEQDEAVVKGTTVESKEPLPEVPADISTPGSPKPPPGSDSAAQPTPVDSLPEPPEQPEEPAKAETTPDEQLVAEELAEMAQIIGASVNQGALIEPVPGNPEFAPGGAISKVKAIRRGGPRKPTRKRKPLTFKPKPRKPKRVQVPILPVNPSGLLPNHLNSFDFPPEEPVENSLPANLPPEPMLKSPTKSPMKTPSHEFLNKLPQLPPNIFKLKLNPDMDSENDSDDSQKLSLVVDESANNSDAETKTDKKEPESAPHPPEEVRDANEIVLAPEDIQPMALTLDDKIENVPIQLVLKECVRTSCLSCNYCRHAHKIAVNGKYLALHLLSEHRYMPIKNETPEDVVNKLKNSLEVLETMCFNTETYDNTDPSIHVPYDQDTTFDCFQCNFACGTHKDLFVHKRKSHSRPLLLCIMCKTNFFSYSEMLCHLCPGHYKAEIMFHNVHINFRCCYCRLDSIPSAFRLMVHLRKSHHTCDICLESCSDQQKLSTHLWKHKVNHLCYRCGISYASKPDITKHLFWKHGHESVLCKKCLQKKWPHVYHFCIPPTSFICEECSASFSKAVALKVHKRLHAEEFPYTCSECEKKFISKKLLLRHEERHRNIELNLNGVSNSLPEEEQKEEIINVTDVVDVKEEAGEEAKDVKDEVKEKSHKKHKKDKKEKVVDLYDLPPLNLSSDSDSSDGEDTPKKVEDESSDPPKPEKDNETLDSAAETVESSVKDITEDSLPKLDASDVAKEDITDVIKSETEDSKPKPAVEKPVEKPSEDVVEIDRQVEGIWENFYKTTQTNHNLPYPLCAMKSEVAYGIIMGDHDYCIPTKTDPVIKDDLPSQSNLDQGFSDDRLEEINIAEKPSETGEEPKKAKSPKKKVKSNNDNDSSSSSDSSSDSDSSSCTCGTNCSCSSSSSNSSSSSSSDSDSSADDKAKQERRKKKKERKAKKSETVQETVKEEKPPEPELPRQPVDPPIQESELETDESSTDEEFYDKQPGRIANQIIAEKRNQLIQSVTPVNNGGVPEAVGTPLPKGSPTKQKPKEKKRRRAPPKPKAPAQAPLPVLQTPPLGQFGQFPGVPTPGMNYGTYGSPSAAPVGYLGTPSVSTPVNSAPPSGPTASDDSSRSSKRRRIPNKFYGYSSGEEEERPMQKWRKPDATPPMPRVQPPPPPVALPPPNTPRIQLTVPKQVIRKPSYHKVQKTPKITIAPPPAPPQMIPPPSTPPPPDSSETDSDADVAASQSLPPPLPQYTSGEPSSSKPEKDVYCYCRCPYDEVSEMIACDDETCPIEWFHFECVGILVPPRGQWYCPGCRKARGLPT